MQADEDAVPGDGKVLLDEVGVLLHRESIGRQRVLRRVRGRAPVRDELLGFLSVDSRPGGHEADEASGERAVLEHARTLAAGCEFRVIMM